MVTSCSKCASLEAELASERERGASLAKEFEEKLASDDRFRRDPGLRLDFFYRRSPYFDRHQNRYPVVRLLYRTV